jgi:uncharacterized protein YciI
MRTNFGTARESPNQESRKAGKEDPGLLEIQGEAQTEVMLSLRIILFCAFTGLTIQSARAEEPKPEKPKQFIYVLRLVPRLHSDTAWTKDDEAVLGRHLARFKEAIQSGQLILAGRTMEPGDKTFGIAIFEAADEAAARAFMQADPAVSGGLMTAEVHPFAVVLQRKNP